MNYFWDKVEKACEDYVVFLKQLLYVVISLLHRIFKIVQENEDKILFIYNNLIVLSN